METVSWIIFYLLLLAQGKIASAHNQSRSPIHSETGTIVPAAHVENGTVNGRYLPVFHQDLFLGIPFANAPRLQNPEPLEDSWKTPFDGSAYGPACYGFGSNQLLALNQSEECLNLNIVRPSGIDANTTLPVLVWIYGGGWTQGSNADPMWNLSHIVQASVENEQPIVAVSINYRLSFLGFPGGDEALKAGVTNLGLKDQRAALAWIQENICAFGGDPDRVTIWGESAGGSSVAFQLVAYGGYGGTDLFRAAMMASGYVTSASNPKPASLYQPQFEKVLAHANCSNAINQLECLRTVPLASIYPFENSTGTTWQPVIDGDFIRRETALELSNGNISRVPIMLGNNADEGLFILNSLPSLTMNSTQELRAIIATLLPALDNSTLDALLAAYPNEAPAPPYSLPISFPWCEALSAANISCSAEYRRAAAILGDWFVDAPRRWMAGQWVGLGLTAYSYRFGADPTSVPVQYWNGLGPGFALHGADLAYDFGLPAGFTTFIDYYPPVKNVSTHIKLSQIMISKFISFVHSLDPNAFNSPDFPDWAPYAQAQTNYQFNASDESVLIHNEQDTYRQEGIEIWNSHILEAYFNEGSPVEGSIQN